jgi:hypothetical protein
MLAPGGDVWLILFAMSDRLNELQRQRALVQEHLAWMEREIAAEMARAGPAPASPAEAPFAGQLPPATPLQWQPPFARPANPVPSAMPAPGEPDAETIMEKYRDEAKDVKQDVRKGCFLYFAIAFLLLGLAVTALYFHTLKRH